MASSNSMHSGIQNPRRSVLVYLALYVTGAVLVSVLFRGVTWRGNLPFAFVLFTALMATKFGRGAAISAAVAAAGVFATLLFHPVGSLRVSNADARMSLVWFLLAAVVVAELFRTFPDDQDHHGSPPETTGRG